MKKQIILQGYKVFKQDIVVIDNFFDNFDVIKDHFRKIPFFKRENYKLGPDEKMGNWPGFRTRPLIESEPFLFNLFLKHYYEKIGYTPEFNVSADLHVRLTEDESKDWIHDDYAVADFSLLVYLSETNLNSGTCFYENNSDIPSTTVNFIQNRALLYDGNIRHMSLLNYGNSIHNGRLTLNCFINSEYYGG